MKINWLANICVGVCLLGVGLGTAGCAGTNQGKKTMATGPIYLPGSAPPMAPNSPRIALNDPERVQPRGFFETYDKAIDQPLPTDGASGSLSGTVQKVRDTYDANQLADDTMRSWEGFVSFTIQREFYTALKSIPGTNLGQAANQVHDSSGRSVVIPFQAAGTAHWTTFRLMTQLRRDRGEWSDVTGTYQAATTGTCPFTPGQIDIVQHDFLIEGTRGGKVVVWGALGSDKLFIVANERRWASQAVNPATGSSAMNAPDKASELFTGKIEANAMTLAGAVHRECQFTLTRKA